MSVSDITTDETRLLQTRRKKKMKGNQRQCRAVRNVTVWKTMSMVSNSELRPGVKEVFFFFNLFIYLFI